ncbi:D-2-hydroxyacid dehydrogenase [Novosphingobium sp. TH158]|uniref:D-2-hydroxyacid dehydrogenase n=1 Tax=Novosphingobium sp. TH158 TaxID=2067455 RepID=UPI000C79D989|nr:D-2-hydroxyacid dehydrogenase [Novosphingobium sp. TH158]PLK26740.1 D-2-hydroxyacid dehydrogenase [Novosphingobium sp. TH158]
MQGHTVVTTLRYQGAHWQGLRDALGEAEVLRFDSPESPGFAEALDRATIAILAKDPGIDILSAPNLRWIHVDHAGLNRAAKPEAFREGLVVTGSSGRSAPVLAEHALFFCLALAYRYPDFLDAQRAHRWGVPGQEDLRGLYGRTMGIVGLGNTGKELALRAKAFGMRVLGYRRRDAEAPAGVDKVFSADAGESLDTLLAESDFVVLALGLSDKTHRLIGERELQLIGPRGYLVNMARGPVVDEAALVRALHAGTIAGAGLDTFKVEPLPQDSPVWDAPNALITPHVTPAVPDRTARSLEIIVENIRRFEAGEPMLNPLTPEDLYTRG